jgi:cytochrome c oxidase subunit 4
MKTDTDKGRLKTERSGMKESLEVAHIVSYRTYIYVWVALVMLLGLTIASAKVYYSSYSVLINLLISSVKAVLVLIFFMHLKYEGRFLKGLVLLTLLVLTSIIALTFSDVWFR